MAAATEWARVRGDEITRGPYRISKAYVSRPHLDVLPIYHAFHRFAFLGSFPGADEAKAYCDQHEALHAAA